MDANAKSVSKILFSGDQFLIPFFQRNYLWRRKDWERLRADLWELLDNDGGKKHFLGPLVCTAVGPSPGEITAFQLIDGQQRLTTLSLLLCAVRDVAMQNGIAELGSKIHENYLIHKYEKGLSRYKIVPRIGDREAFIALVERKPVDEFRHYRLFEAYQFFRKHINQHVHGDGEASLKRLFDAIIGGLYLVVITIDEENPYEIFESLNSTGLPLAESDLIRNFIFMHVPLVSQQEFHADHWEKYEQKFEKSGDYDEIPATAFYRNFLMRNGVYSKANATFLDFKTYCQRQDFLPEKQLLELEHFIRLELQLRRPGTCENESIRKQLSRIALLEVTTAHPLLLNLFDRYDTGIIDNETFLGCLDDLVSFIIRRSICGESTRRYGVWFCEAIKAIADKPRENLRNYWLHRGWPDDHAFTEALVILPIYRRETKKCRVILEAIEESYGHKEKVDPSTLSIEHVMPQSIGRDASGAAWKKMLGDDWKKSHEQWLHTIGNLTLTGYNPKLSNKPFGTKQPELAKSNLLLNNAFRDLVSWNAEAIQKRGKLLAEKAAKLWPRPEKGPHYFPPRPAKRIKGKDRRRKYWGQFLELMRSGHKQFELPEGCDSTSLSFPTGINNVALQGWYKRSQKSLVAVLHFQRRRGHQIYESLESNKLVIEKELGFPLQWQRKPRWEISVLRTGTSIKDPIDWQEQHVWLAEKIDAFNKLTIPRIRAIHKELESKELTSVSREHWESLVGTDSITVCDTVLELINLETNAEYVLNYNKRHIGLSRDGRSDNIVWFYPRLNAIVLNARLRNRDAWKGKLEAIGVTAKFKGKRQIRYSILTQGSSELRKLTEEFVHDAVQERYKAGTAKERNLKFWTEFVKKLDNVKTMIVPHPPRSQPGMKFAIGRANIRLFAWTNAKRRRVSVGLMLSGSHARSRFITLKQDKAEIEREIGESLEWNDDPKKKQLSVLLRQYDLEIGDETTWPITHGWLIEKLELFHKVFSQRVKVL